MSGYRNSSSIEVAENGCGAQRGRKILWYRQPTLCIKIPSSSCSASKHLHLISYSSACFLRLMNSWLILKARQRTGLKQTFHFVSTTSSNSSGVYFKNLVTSLPILLPPVTFSLIALHVESDHSIPFGALIWQEKVSDMWSRFRPCTHWKHKPWKRIWDRTFDIFPFFLYFLLLIILSRYISHLVAYLKNLGQAMSRICRKVMVFCSLSLVFLCVRIRGWALVDKGEIEIRNIPKRM